MYDKNIIFRLAINYRLESSDTGSKSFVKLQDILEDFNNSCSEKESCDLHVFELGRILPEVFAGLKKFQKSGKNSWQTGAKPRILVMRKLYVNQCIRHFRH